MNRLKIIIFISIMLCGCTYQEVHERTYLREISISGTSEKTVSMNFYDKDSVPTTASNQDFEGILKDSEVLSGKSIFTGHTEVIILGECDYKETLCFMLEEWKVSPSCLVVYGGENCSDIIKNSKDGKLSDIIKTATEQKKIPENDIITVLNSLLRDNKAEIPVITSDGNFENIIIS